MKKLLLSTIIVLIIILIGITTVKGLRIGKLNILGIIDIKKGNEELDSSIKQATKLASTDYQRKIDDLDEATRALEKEKQTYEDLLNVSTDNEKEAILQSYENKVEFLFVRIENYAKSEGVEIKMDVLRKSTGIEDLYDLEFTVVGAYAQIEEFITDIEDDSKLGYKIENFKMLPTTDKKTESIEELVKATFVCKNIKITGISSGMTMNTNNQTTEISESGEE